ncbi:MAG TPA: phosphatase PAP2 family protein [Candidatus Dormibacteraeota bacterium]|nr:phosphatase PAP2 family protein [Candidatus Dormibacteraeota bacterium]
MSDSSGVPRLRVSAALGFAFIALTSAVSAGAFTSLDLQVAQAMHDAWIPSLHVPFQLIAELGSVEVTGVLMIGLTVYLWRSGFGSDALVFVVLIAAELFEVFYKFTLHHVRPPHSLAQADGPSLTMLFTGPGPANSFPSGHMMRTVIVYGLLAFVIRRLSPSPRVRTLTGAGAIAVILLMAFDRLYLDVHWESDVLGGLLLGAIALLAGTVWLDRPRKVKNSLKK